MNFAKFNRVIHRDAGYLIAGLAIIYSLSGIALNHKNDWNPNYLIESREFTSNIRTTSHEFTKDDAGSVLKSAGLNPDFKSFYFPKGNTVSIFIEGGIVKLNTSTGYGAVERISRRLFFYQINLLHYNPGKWWKYFSDLFCLALIAVSITGLFIIKGRNGITRRGAILTIIGILLPIIFLLVYL